MSSATAELESDPGIGNARAAVALVFVVHGLLFASWTAHIPAVAHRIGLDNAHLGLVLLGAPAGAVCSVIVSGTLLPRVGTRLAIRASLLEYCLAGLLVGAAGSAWTLGLALFAWGFGMGVLDVSMNTQAVYVQRRAGRPIMSGLHGAWGLGAFAGAAAGTAGVALGLGLVPQLLLLGLPALAAGLALSRRLLSDEPHVAEPRDGWSPPPLALVLLAVAAFGSMLCEGAAADWSAVYLRTSAHASAAVGGLGYTVFALALVAVRLAGDRLQRSVPPHRLVSGLALLAAVGFGVGLAVGGSVPMLIGLGFLGAGLGLVVPTTFAAAGRLPGRHPGRGVATVSGLGGLGFVAGPPAIGGLASLSSLANALALLPALALVAALVAARLRP